MVRGHINRTITIPTDCYGDVEIRTWNLGAVHVTKVANRNHLHVPEQDTLVGRCIPLQMGEITIVGEW